MEIKIYLCISRRQVADQPDAFAEGSSEHVYDRIDARHHVIAGIIQHGFLKTLARLTQLL